jgi:hypothetical protein
MNFADLTDTVFRFSIVNSETPNDLWKYDLLACAYDSPNFRHLCDKEINHLKQNCERILQAIQDLQGA